MTPRKEQRDRCWGDLELKTNADGLRYVKFSAPSAKQKRELVKTQEMSEDSSTSLQYYPGEGNLLLLLLLRLRQK